MLYSFFTTIVQQLRVKWVLSGQAHDGDEKIYGKHVVSGQSIYGIGQKLIKHKSTYL